MDRQIIYPGQIPLDTDLLNTSKNAYVGLGKLASALMGTATVTGTPVVVTNGLAVGPTGPATLNVVVSPGEIYSLQNIDNSTYGSLAADTADQMVKQGIMLAAVTLPTPAPGTAGQSINYLIQAQFVESDTGSVVLPYYNASNPSVAWSGPANAGTPNNTNRSNVCTVSVVNGTAATTGTQSTPAPSANAVGLAVVTVANGQATVTAGNITPYSGAITVPRGGLASAVMHSMYSKNVAGNSNVTLTDGEAAFPILTLTGTLTGNILVYVNQPATTPAVRQRIINNQTSGGYTVTLITQAGTGIICPQGYSIPTYCDGTNIVNGMGAWEPLGDARYGSGLFNVGATVSANALTGTLGGCKLDFRSPTLTTGTPIVVDLATPLSITVPSTATLGTTNGVAARLVWLVAYNGGTPVLCVTNLAGGLQLDETNLISPTTISTGATSAGVIYSASAVGANSPYRVVGFTDITEATAGTWATAPSTVQPTGGQVLVSLGVNSQVANGYQKLPGGLILQWGTQSITTTPTNYNFPLAFPNQCLAMVGSAQAAGASIVNFNPVSASQFSAYSNVGSPGVMWWAIGK